MARSLGYLFGAGATIAVVALLLFPLPAGTDVGASTATALAGYVAAALLLLGATRFSRLALQGWLACGTGLATLGIYFSGESVTDNEMFYLWVSLYAGYFLSRRERAVQLALVGAGYAAALTAQQATAPPVTRWLVTMGTLAVATELVAGLRQSVTRERFFDPLTALPNRNLFVRRLGGALERARAHGRRGAVLFVDVDRFQDVNQSLGHEYGDRLLSQVATRLRQRLRPQDVVARFGGDTFTVLLDGLETGQHATAIADRVSEQLRDSYPLDGGEVFLTASIGVAFDRPDGQDPQDLLREAALAMSRAKQTGKGHYEVFDATMSGRAIERLRLQNDLRRALEGDEFRLAYQPTVDLDSGRILGLEALLRWDRPRRGVILPGQFIGCAEETGLIVPLGRKVLRDACAQARAWQDRFPEGPPLKVYVNLSGRQFQQPGLTEDVSESLEAAGISPCSLVLEVTENVVMTDEPHKAAALRELKELGVRLALDDFGIGYSSLSVLKRLPFDILKVDRTFVAGMLEREENLAIVEAIVSLGKTLGLFVIAEGIENSQQAARLRTLGCELGQGYHFAKPKTADEITDLLAARLERRVAA